MFLSFEQQLELVNKGLATSKQVENLVTFKYARKVMYDYLWDKHPELLECRGHTYNAVTGELVIAAPRKSFNYLENGNWKNVDLDTKVKMYKKFNGFMATLSVYKGEIIIGTTGTTNSDFAKMAREMILSTWDEDFITSSWGDSGTFLFEICHPNDPHIVYEEPGAYYLGYRSKVTSHNYDCGQFVPVPNRLEDVHLNVTLREAIEITNSVKHEGFMVYDEFGNVCKMKSPYYVGKKKLMRATKARVEAMYANPNNYLIAGEEVVDQMWKPIVQKIVTSVDVEDWKSYTDQQRRQIIERIELEAQ